SGFLIHLANVNALKAQEKPQLIPITMSEETNDPKALAITKKLDPDFFYVDPEYLGGSPDAKFIARYVPLDKTDPKRFIVVGAFDTPYYCTAHGCPYYFYENTEPNKWRLALSVQANNVWY